MVLRSKSFDLAVHKDLYYTLLLQNLEPLIHINFLEENTKPDKNTKLQY